MGLLSVIGSVPFIARRVPMNHVFGFRLPQAFESERNWYAINAYGGKWLLAFGLFLLAFGQLTAEQAPPPDSAWAPVYLLVPMLALVPVLLFVTAYARRMGGR
jgi:hypothetical protein